MFVEERFHLQPQLIEDLRKRPIPWGFGLFSQVIYYRTYSRTREDGTQEQWADTVQRVVEGAMSIRKDWYIKHGLRWDENRWSGVANRMATFIFDMKFLPPGRGLWAMGTNFVYERGSMSLNNCGYVDVTTDLADAAGWAMDALMNGVGVGFSTENARLGRGYIPDPSKQDHYAIPDSREGWVIATKKLIDSYFSPSKPIVVLDYSLIRPAGAPIRGFGGVSAGPGPLKLLHERIRMFLATYARGQCDHTRLIADTFNAIGACVVAGNVRRSAEIAMGRIGDNTFLNLKNYDANPERIDWGWMSNNSILLSDSDEFELLPKIAARIRDNGEPGIANLINIQKYARMGKKKRDNAIGFNPCAEIPLESKELCNLVEVFPHRCSSLEEIWEAHELATIYSSTVSLLPTQDYETNAVVTRNRRIGVSNSGIADYLDANSLSRVTMTLRKGYENVVEPLNAALAEEAGVRPSVRLTTVKPSGTVSLLAGASPGMHWPVSRYAIRRMRIGEDNAMIPMLEAARVPNEADTYSANTRVFEFPLMSGQGRTRSVKEVSIWEQANMVSMLQREWADNAVSNTLTFQKQEEGQLEAVMASVAPVIKSISMLPDQDTSDHAYSQLPYEAINLEEYNRRRDSLGTIDWSTLTGQDGEEEIFCTNDRCEIPGLTV
jgi:ribonucleoside-triphosphate reductase